MNKRGFSLIDLVITIVIIAILTVATTPVVTKKLNTLKKVSTTRISYKCDRFDEYCKLCFKSHKTEEDKCLICTKGCASNQYLDKEKCKCHPCSDYDTLGCVDCCKTCNSSYCRSCDIGVGYNKTNGECSICLPGTYSNTADESSCLLCDKGTYQANSRQSECKECPEGFYQDEKGRASCKPCPVNSTTALSGAVSIDECICNEGYYRENDNCKKCEAGYYCIGQIKYACKAGTYSDAEGATSEATCQKCPCGHIYDTSTANTNCTNNIKITCQAGTYIKDAGITSGDSCNSCTGRKYSSSAGACECSECASDEFANDTHTGCNSCSLKWGSACITCTSSECTGCIANWGLEAANGVTSKTCCRTVSSNSDCQDYKDKYGESVFYNNKCIAVKNTGASNTDITIVGPDQTCSGACCWTNITDNNSSDYPQYFTANPRNASTKNDPTCLYNASDIGSGLNLSSAYYSGTRKVGNASYTTCHRTVCNLAALNYLCTGKLRRILRTTDLVGMPEATLRKLNFCDASSNTSGFPICKSAINGNPYTNQTSNVPSGEKHCNSSSGCRPSNVFFGDNKIMKIDKGEWANVSSSTVAGSVRCVITHVCQ